MRVLFLLTCLFFSVHSRGNHTRFKHLCESVPNEDYDIKALDKEEDAEARLKKIAILNCKSFPIVVLFQPSELQIPKDHDPESKTLIRLQHINAIPLEHKDDEQLTKLLIKLSEQTVHVEWVNRHKKQNTHSLEINGAAALALGLAIQRNFELISRMMSLTPELILPLFHGPLSVLADYQFTSMTVLTMIKKPNNEHLIKACSTLLAGYIRSWTFKKHKNLTPILAQLHLQMSHLIYEEGSAYSLDTRQKGILIGSLLAGAFKFSQEIKSKDERRIWIINTASNLGWAATSFLGVIPIAGNIIAVIGGVASVAFVVISAFYTKNGPHDESPNIREVEGNIELRLLNAIDQKSESQRIEVGILLDVMRAVVHLNGFSD